MQQMKMLISMIVYGIITVASAYPIVGDLDRAEDFADRDNTSRTGMYNTPLCIYKRNWALAWKCINQAVADYT